MYGCKENLCSISALLFKDNGINSAVFLWQCHLCHLFRNLQLSLSFRVAQDRHIGNPNSVLLVPFQPLVVVLLRLQRTLLWICLSMHTFVLLILIFHKLSGRASLSPGQCNKITSGFQSIFAVVGPLVPDMLNLTSKVLLNLCVKLLTSVSYRPLFML